MDSSDHPPPAISRCPTHPGDLQVSLWHFLSGHPCPTTCKGRWRAGVDVCLACRAGVTSTPRGAVSSSPAEPLKPPPPPWAPKAIFQVPSGLSTQPAAGGGARPHAAPLRRQLSMMLMLAQSNPQLFALIGTRANVTKELERVERQSRLEQLSPAELLSKNRAHWTDWLQEYR